MARRGRGNMLTEEEERRVAELYREDTEITIDALARRFACSHGPISRALEKHGVVCRNGRKRRPRPAQQGAA